ncbi:MAG: FAD-binding oxidoreductase [Chloroflexi bacterium]|nr:FAD-binding oxidoreductase [Chloroflexota bacterium]
MRRIDEKGRAFLTGLFGGWVSFDRVERKLYGHDIAALPGLMRPVVGGTLPDAVVQPATEAELVSLVRWAAENSVPLTPRGKATSGYGGTLPVRNGLVVDFHHLNRIVGIDAAAETATVEAGVVWEKLDSELARHDLTLRLYPTSYPSATVGGWLAQGGSGIGSYEMGTFRENAVSACVVLPGGEVKDIAGAELDLVSDAEGITGLISRVTLRVQRLEELGVAGVSCPTAENLQSFLEDVIGRGLPVWSVLFINPRMAELRNQAPLREHLGNPVEERVELPAAHIITLAFRKRDDSSVRRGLAGILEKHQACLLPDSVARHEWQNRFKIMLVKRLGPSLVPAEIVVPLSRLAAVMDEINRKVTQPVVKEGIVIRNGAGGQPEVTILGFIPCDQRRFSYPFVFTPSLSILKIAQKHGGRPYSTGLYFPGKAAEVLGAGRAGRLREYKHKIDPGDILNPGKVTAGGSLLGWFMKLAAFAEPLARPLGNRMSVRIGERPAKPVRGIPADIAWYAYGCSQCGYCVTECDQFSGRGWESQSPRGKWYWLREYMEGRERWNQAMVDTFLACTTCELCNLRCSASLPIESSWTKLRGQLVHERKRMTFPPFEIMSAALRKEGDIWAGYRKDRGNWFPEELLSRHGPARRATAVYFAGCTASYVERDIGLASGSLPGSRPAPAAGTQPARRGLLAEAKVGAVSSSCLETLEARLAEAGTACQRGRW